MEKARAHSLHFVLADTAGDVWYQQLGAVPRRSGGWSGLYAVAAGSDRQWTGFYDGASVAGVSRAAGREGGESAGRAAGPGPSASGGRTSTSGTGTAAGRSGAAFMLVTPADWRLHLIDNERAFAPSPPADSLVKDARSRLEEPIEQKLAALDRDAVSTELKGLLSEDEIAALLARVDLLLPGS